MRASTLALAGAVVALACGPVGTTAGTTTPSGGQAPVLVDLRPLVPAGAVVVLRADLTAVRQDPARYEWFAGELVRELGLTPDSGALRPILDRTDVSMGVFLQGTGPHREGFLAFAGRFTGGDLNRVVAIAQRRHGGPPQVQQLPGGDRLVAFGSATVRTFGGRVFAVGHGAQARSALASARLQSDVVFRQNLAEFGARIGLPRGSSQAWASQDTEVGSDMFNLVLQGENERMVANFVATVQRHLGM